jgi:hypothetical protein
MSFVYDKYVKDLLNVLNDPQKWLGNEQNNLNILNEVITDYNNIYTALDAASKKTSDDKYPNCKGLIDKITNVNDADRLLFAVFGYGHPMNPNEKINNLRQCLKLKLVAIGTPAADAAAAKIKNKYLKYKNKYLSLKSKV